MNKRIKKFVQEIKEESLFQVILLGIITISVPLSILLYKIINFLFF